MSGVVVRLPPLHLPHDVHRDNITFIFYSWHVRPYRGEDPYETMSSSFSYHKMTSVPFIANSQWFATEVTKRGGTET
jgi:hypothetical protein